MLKSHNLARGLVPRFPGPLLFGVALATAGCSAGAPGDDSPREEPAIGGASQPATTGTARSELLVTGVRETLVDGIASAENSMFTSTDRLLVSGDDGVYEVLRGASGPARAVKLSAESSCKFAGLAEANGVAYANCYDGTNSKVFAAALAPKPTFQAIYDLPGVSLANGAAADGSGGLYVADSTHGTIWRLSLDPTNPLRVLDKVAFSTGNLFPNGLKFFDSSIYFTDFLAVKRIPLLTSGAAGTVSTLFAQLTFFDDLYVDPKGILVANYLFGALAALTPSGVDAFDTAGLTFSGPSSVLPAKGRLGLASTDIVVTEKNANRVAVFHPR